MKVGLAAPINISPADSANHEARSQFVAQHYRDRFLLMQVHTESGSAAHAAKRCIQTIAEFESHRYPDKKDDDKNEPEVPIKKNDHALDALRYALFMNAPANDNEEVEFGLYGASYG